MLENLKNNKKVQRILKKIEPPYILFPLIIIFTITVVAIINIIKLDLLS